MTEWSAKRVHDYFVSHGFAADICQTLLEQEIDGGSLLLLHRTDVLTNLGLKLGPQSVSNMSRSFKQEALQAGGTFENNMCKDYLS